MLAEASTVAIDALDRLVGLGVRLALDDFGRGATSVAALRRFPVAEVRLDGEVVRSALHDDVDRELVRAVVGLARALGLVVSAEGVETTDQLGSLVDLGVDTVQGRHVAAPMTAAELLSWLDARAVDATR